MSERCFYLVHKYADFTVIERTDVARDWFPDRTMKVRVPSDRGG